MGKVKYGFANTQLLRWELVELHTAVFLFGFAGLFGKIISLPAMLIVLGRVLFASAFLLLILLYRGESLRIEGDAKIFLPVLGVLLALHWSTFFYSIQISTVAIGLLTYSTFPIFTAIIEPLVFRERIRAEKVILSFIAFSGVVLIIPSFNLSNQYTQGALWGLLSGFAFSLLTIVNRRYVKEHSSLKLAFYQDSFASIFLLPFIFIFPFKLSTLDFLYLAVLGVIFTGLAHTLFIHSLLAVRANTASIIATLESLYGIILAFIVLGEVPTARTIFGGAIILGVCLYVSRFGKI